jgi:hypothetical protein
MAARENATMQNAAVQHDIVTETLLLGTQRHLQETQPNLWVLARVERAQALVYEMLPQERAYYFAWLAARRGLANPAA